LYHDIGKMQKAEYFVENQRAGSNPHNNLKPKMSALIIANHVKKGLELAKENNLPERVVNFIPTHHGTARIEYFYRKAVEQTDPNDPPILESEFRYPGPRPNSKETGILMLADSIEAASRSLDDPTHNRLKSLIDLIFKERIEDGQLDNTDLTFRDLRQIKDKFLQMLMGIYHVRVKYPDQDEESTEETQSVVALPDDVGPDTYETVSILWENDVIGTPEQSVSAEQLRSLPGVRETRAPRPDVAEASPHHRSGRPRPVVGDGATSDADAAEPDPTDSSDFDPDAAKGRKPDSTESAAGTNVPDDSTESPNGAPETDGDEAQKGAEKETKDS
jgi:hypothetical protein